MNIEYIAIKTSRPPIVKQMTKDTTWTISVKNDPRRKLYNLTTTSQSIVNHSSVMNKLTKQTITRTFLFFMSVQRYLQSTQSPNEQLCDSE